MSESGVVKPEVMRERALFYLDRKLNELEAKTDVVDHVDMAKAGMTYEQRLTAEARQTAAAEKVSNELGAWRWVRDLVQNTDV